MFKFSSPLLFCKSNCGFYVPRTQFGRVRNITGVVLFQACMQIFCKPRIKTLFVTFTLKNINVEEFHFCWLAES